MNIKHYIIIFMGYFINVTVNLAAIEDNKITSNIIPVRLEDYPIYKALADIESGSNDRARGKLKEVSRYQILPHVWKEAGYFPLEKDYYRNSNAATQVADKLVQDLSKQFKCSVKREMSTIDIYIMWNAGFEYYRQRNFTPKKISKKILERAIRYDNLYKKYNAELVTHLKQY